MAIMSASLANALPLALYITFNYQVLQTDPVRAQLIAFSLQVGVAIS